MRSAAVACLAVCAAAAQQIGPEESHVTSRPYNPLSQADFRAEAIESRVLIHTIDLRGQTISWAATSCAVSDEKQHIAAESQHLRIGS